MTRRSRPWMAAALILGLAGCTTPTRAPASTPDPSVAQESASPTAAAAEACPALTITTPSGEAVDLSGEWGGGEWFPTPGSGERTFVLHRGTCLWAVIMDAEFRANPAPEASQLAQYSGTLGSDLSVKGTLVVLVRWNDPFSYGSQAPGPYPMDWRIVFDEDGGVTLVEDRVPGVEGPRCPNPIMWCPAPTVLRPIGPIAEPAP